MSYLVGLTVGTLIAEQFRRSGGGGGRLELVHRIAHRRRYYHPGIKRDRRYAEKLEHDLRSCAELSSVLVNRTTGSVVITYNCSEEKIDRLMGRYIASPRVDGVRETARFRRGIKDLFAALDAGVYKKSGGCLDLPSSLAVMFLAWGTHKTLKLKQWPNGTQMLWWSYRLLKK